MGEVTLVDHPELYSLDSSAVIWALPPAELDYDNPEELLGVSAPDHSDHMMGPIMLNNSLLLNGESKDGVSITPDP